MVNKKNLKNPFVTLRLVLITYCHIQVFTIHKNTRRAPCQQIVTDANEHVHRYRSNGVLQVEESIVSDNLLTRCTACILANGEHLDVTICDQD